MLTLNPATRTTVLSGSRPRQARPGNFASVGGWQQLRRLGLLARFTIVGLVVGALVAGGLAWSIEARMTDLLLADVAARAADQVDHLGLAGFVSAEDFTLPHTPQRLDSVARRLDPLFAHMRVDGSGVIRLQVFSRDGTIIYSDLASKRGATIDLDDEDHLAEALDGQMVREISDLDEPENRELREQYHQALEVYVPLEFDGQVVGAYEIYQDLAPVQAARPFVWGAVLGGFALLFGALLVVVRAAAILIQRQQQTLAHQAFHDPLTDLPNRALFLERAGRALARGPVAVIFVDLDGVKLVNDSLGHLAGDQLLATAGGRLAECCTPGDTAARMGGDEFAVLLEDVSDPAWAISHAQRLLSVIRKPALIDGRELFPTASIGIALSTSDTLTAEPLLREADLAMYCAKTRGKNGFAVFDQTMASDAAERLSLETDLRRALERHEFYLHYQPILSLADGRIAEVEALVRWRHPVRGLVSPATFIPVAEQTGLIIEVGQWVLEQACQQAAAWQSVFGDRAPIMGVNLSARQFQRPELVAEVEHALRIARLEPARLKLEITESVAMQDAQATVQTLQALKDLGIGLAIDDFGTGYSSLAYLKRFPVDTLKIDRSFIDGLAEDAYDTAIVQSILALAGALGLSVTGEGIETVRQRDQLRLLGCDRGQGFLFARPQAGGELEVLLSAGEAVRELRAA
jgi:diguanylate cyclase (GGDEF)-like protein